jgi:hypothetical protein
MVLVPRVSWQPSRTHSSADGANLEVGRHTDVMIVYSSTTNEVDIGTIVLYLTVLVGLARVSL